MNHLTNKCTKAVKEKPNITLNEAGLVVDSFH